MQPPTPLQTENSMAGVVVNGKIHSKQTKAMDMHFHWLRYIECQEPFRIYWRPEKQTTQTIGKNTTPQNITKTLEKNY